jgi:hypothetical protein
VLEAARIAPDLRFRIVGSGQLEPLLGTADKRRARCRGSDYERLPDELHRAGCALGVFGTRKKPAG